MVIFRCSKDPKQQDRLSLIIFQKKTEISGRPIYLCSNHSKSKLLPSTLNLTNLSPFQGKYIAKL